LSQNSSLYRHDYENTIGGYFMTQKWDVVIVGGGLAGYVAANFLSKTNLSILLLEKGKHIGGRARTNKVNGQLFNLGPHALYKKGEAKSILEELDVKLLGKSPKLGGTLIENNQEYIAPFNPFAVVSTELLNWKKRIEWLAVLLKISRVDLDLLEPQTFQQWTTKATHSTKIQSLLYVLCRLSTYCTGPEMMSATLALSHMKKAMGGVLYLDGGWETLMEQLHHKAIISGVHVQTEKVVKQIVPLGYNQLKLVLSNGTEVFGKYVISTTGPHELGEMIGKNNTLENSFLSPITPIRGATLDVALTKLTNPKRLFAMGISEPLYYSVHSTYAQLSNDAKNTVLHVFKYLHPDDPIDGKKVKTELEQFLEKLQPGWQKHVITSRFLPQITVNQRLPQIGDEQRLMYETPLPGLYVAGDWACPDAILADGAVCSGKKVAEKIMTVEGQV
jgi:phytoene dehydrogenase-like protein